MKQVEAVAGSNAARKTSDNGAKSEGSVTDLGYSVYGYVKTGPAEANSDLKITKDNFSFKDANDGTSISSYNHQPKDPSAESGK